MTDLVRVHNAVSVSCPLCLDAARESEVGVPIRVRHSGHLDAIPEIERLRRLRQDNQVDAWIDSLDVGVRVRVRSDVEHRTGLELWRGHIGTVKARTPTGLEITFAEAHSPTSSWFATVDEIEPVDADPAGGEWEAVSELRALRAEVERWRDMARDFCPHDSTDGGVCGFCGKPDADEDPAPSLREWRV